MVKLTPSDWQLFKKIRLESLLEEPQAFASSYSDYLQKPDSFWQGRLIDAQAGENSWLLFAKVDERMVGMIGAYRSPESAAVEIISVYVSKEHRRQGVGGALMAAILEKVGNHGGVGKAELTVNQDQAAAVALYRHFGFQTVGEKAGVMGDGYLHHGYIMQKELK